MRRDLHSRYRSRRIRWTLPQECRKPDSLSHLDACLGRQMLRERLPGADIAGVIAGGKLGDLQAAIGFGEAGLGARAAERRPGGHQDF
jgi:hypothetical protein